MNKKLFYGWVLVCVVLNFLANKNVEHCRLIYSMAGLLLAIYLFPIYPIMSRIKEEKMDWKKLLFLIFSYFVLASVVSFSIVLLYSSENETINNIHKIFCIINGILAWGNLFVKDNVEKSILHFIFALFIVEVV